MIILLCAINSMHNITPVIPNLFETTNLIASCWPEVLLFQRWGLLLVLFLLALSIVFSTNSVSHTAIVSCIPVGKAASP